MRRKTWPEENPSFPRADLQHSRSRPPLHRPYLVVDLAGKRLFARNGAPKNAPLHAAGVLQPADARRHDARNLLGW